MCTIIVARNRANGLVERVPRENWRKNRNQWARSHDYVKTVQEPPEVAELKALIAAEKRQAIEGEGKK
jgi:hypothetical protein